MTKIYACLIGNWVCLNDDPNCTISEYLKDPYLWWKEDAPIHSPMERNPESENSFYELDYVRLVYLGKEYRISPTFVQIVTE